MIALDSGTVQRMAYRVPGVDAQFFAVSEEIPNDDRVAVASGKVQWRRRSVLATVGQAVQYFSHSNTTPTNTLRTSVPNMSAPAL